MLLPAWSTEGRIATRQFMLVTPNIGPTQHHEPSKPTLTLRFIQPFKQRFTPNHLFHESGKICRNLAVVEGFEGSIDMPSCAVHNNCAVSGKNSIRVYRAQ